LTSKKEGKKYVRHDDDSKSKIHDSKSKIVTNKYKFTRTSKNTASTENVGSASERSKVQRAVMDNDFKAEMRSAPGNTSERASE
jgi:hypothetical protein